MVKVIYGHYLLKQGQKAPALEKLGAAHISESKDANVAYNLGLAYFDAGDFGKALENAHLAYKMGFPLPGLRDKLRRVGKWREATPVISEDKAEMEAPGAAAVPLPSSSAPADKGN